MCAELGNAVNIWQPASAEHKQVLAVRMHHVPHALQRINPCNSAGPYMVPGKRLTHTVLHLEVRHLHLAYVYPLNPWDQYTHVSHDTALVL